MSYDSKADTLEHIKEVNTILLRICQKLMNRAMYHDASKLRSPEKEVFDEMTPKLKSTAYGSPEYLEHFKAMNVALEHHYRENRHHPQHHMQGIGDMTLIDIIEMLADWKAATLRHDNGDIRESIEIAVRRFDLDETLKQILINTVNDFRW